MRSEAGRAGSQSACQSVSQSVGLCVGRFMFMHGGDKDQGPTSRSPDRVRINNKLEAVKCGCGAEKKWTRPAEGSVQCIALHEDGGVMVIADIAVFDQSFIIRQTNKHQQRQQQQARIIIIIVFSGRTAAHARWGMAGSLWPHRLLSNVHAGRIHRPTRAQSYPARVP